MSLFFFYLFKLVFLFIYFKADVLWEVIFVIVQSKYFSLGVEVLIMFKIIINNLIFLWFSKLKKTHTRCFAEHLWPAIGCLLYSLVLFIFLRYDIQHKIAFICPLNEDDDDVLGWHLPNVYLLWRASYWTFLTAV